MKSRLFYFSFFAAVTFVLYSIPEAQTVTWVSTIEQNPWNYMGMVPVTEWDEDRALYIEIDEKTKYQKIDGWGGAINEYGWVAMSVFSQAEREKILRALFDTSGCAFNLGRICIGANDYSLSFYSCNDSPGDYEMTSFSLDRDKVNVIPFALAAKAVNSDIKFWGAPHSPPAWMKRNNSMIDGSLKTDDATRKAWALYFKKWVEGMAAEGVPVYAVQIQNEPNISGTGYPTCLMSGDEMALLIRNYLGPLFRQTGLNTEIWLGTLHSSGNNHNDFYPEYIPPSLGDPVTSAYISGVGMQWNALWAAHKVVENFPYLKTMQTEAECGNFPWMPDYNPDIAPNDWSYAVFITHRMIQWLKAGVNSYFQWNMILEENDKNNTINTPWPQNSMISIIKSEKRVRYNPQFYAVKHFTHFIKPGAIRIAAEGNYSAGGSNLISRNIGETVTDGDMIAFVNTNGDKILVIRNSCNADRTVAVKSGAVKFKPTIPANSFNTFLIEDHSSLKYDFRKKSPTSRIKVNVHPHRVIISIQHPSESFQKSSVSITDPSGKTIKTMHIFTKNNHFTTVWNLTNEYGKKAGPGLYIVRSLTNEQSIVRSFVLQ